MARNKLGDLRDHLFETIELLKDDQWETKMSVDRAQAISAVAQTIINSAKLELDYIKSTSSHSGLKPVTDFLGASTYLDEKEEKLKKSLTSKFAGTTNPAK